MLKLFLFILSERARVACERTTNTHPSNQYFLIKFLEFNLLTISIQFYLFNFFLFSLSEWARPVRVSERLIVIAKLIFFFYFLTLFSYFQKCCILPQLASTMLNILFREILQRGNLKLTFYSYTYSRSNVYRILLFFALVSEFCALEEFQTAFLF